MRKLILLALVGILIWFFGFSDPMIRNEVYSMFKTPENAQLDDNIGKPVAPELVQKMYQPHLKGMNE